MRKLFNKKLFTNVVCHFVIIGSKYNLLFKSYEHFHLLTTGGPTDRLTHDSVCKMSWLRVI